VAREQARWWERRIGLQPVSEGVWMAYFASHPLGLFDERRGRIERLQAPQRRDALANTIPRRRQREQVAARAGGTP